MNMNGRKGDGQLEMKSSTGWLFRNFFSMKMRNFKAKMILIENFLKVKYGSRSQAKINFKS